MLKPISFHPIVAVAVAAVGFGLLASGCGSASETSAEPTSPTIIDPVDGQSSLAVTAVSEQDIGQARRVFDAATELWNDRARSPYVMTVHFGTLSEIELSFDEGHVLLSEQVISGDPDFLDDDLLPHSVSAAFTLVEDSLGAFESGALDVPSIDECGSHFNATFDGETGYVRSFDTLGPCDDGIGIEMTIRPNETDGIEPAAVVEEDDVSLEDD